MKHIRQTSEIVKQVLMEQPDTRNSDDLLYIRVCARCNNIAVNLPFHRVLLNRKEMNLPPYESVRRSRQKLQAKYPELAGTGDVEAQRILNEETMKEYARAST